MLGTLKATVGVLIAMALLAGCATVESSEWDPSSVSSASQHAEKLGYVEAVDALADGKVTREEWRALHILWVECKEKLGYDFAEPLLDPVNQQEFLEKREYKGAGVAPSEADEQACDDRYDFSVGQIYYLTVGPSMDPALLAATHACLDAAGIPYAGDEKKYRDFFLEGDPTSAADGPVAECVEQETLKLFPDVSIVNLNF